MNEPPPELNPTKIHLLREWKYDAPFLGCRCDPSGRFVIATAQDHTLQRWDLQEDTHTTFGGHDSWARAIDFSPDGTRLYTGGYDGQLLFWETAAEELKPLQNIAAHNGWIRAVATSPDGLSLVSVGNDLQVKRWSTETGALVWASGGHESHVYSVAYHAQGTGIATGDLLGIVRHWDAETGAVLRTYDASQLHTYNGGQGVHYGGVRSMAFNAAGDRLACSGLHNAPNPLAGVQEPLVLVFDWATEERQQTLEANEIPRGIVWRVVWHPKGTIIGASGGSSGGHLIFWNGTRDAAEKDTDFHQFKLPDTVRDMDLHPNGIDIVTVHNDQRIRIHRMA